MDIKGEYWSMFGVSNEKLSVRLLVNTSIDLENSSRRQIYLVFALLKRVFQTEEIFQEVRI